MVLGLFLFVILRRRIIGGLVSILRSLLGLLLFGMNLDLIFYGSLGGVFFLYER